MPTEQIDDEDEIVRRAQRRLRDLKSFYYHLVSYAAVNVLLHIINLMAGGGYWAIWPLLGWGIAIVLHGARIYAPFGFLDSAWEERKLAQLIEQERRRSGPSTRRQ